MKDQELNTEHSIAVSKRNLKASIIDAFFPNEMHNQNIDDDDRKILEMYADATGYSIQDIDISDAQDAFHGTADSYAEFAENMAEECGYIPKDMPSWIEIDWEASWNCNLRYDYMTATDENGTIYFFFNC